MLEMLRLVDPDKRKSPMWMAALAYPVRKCAQMSTMSLFALMSHIECPYPELDLSDIAFWV